MREEARRLARITAGADPRRLEEDEVFRLAVERMLQNIGEAARRVSEAFQRSHPAIPRRRIVGQRHVLVHQYDAAELPLTRRLIAEDIPELLRLLDALLPPGEA